MTRIIRASEVNVAVAATAETGEGPVWDVARDALLWVDIPRGQVHRWRPGNNEVSTVETAQPVGALALRERGGLVVALRDGFGLLDESTGEVDLRAEVEAEILGNRMNDGKCDTAGRFWAGSMDDGMREGSGSLYRLDPDFCVTRMLADVSVSNGLGWSPDDRLMYYIDSLAHGVDVFDFDLDAGTIENRRRFVEIPGDDGLPDGMTIDASGCLWVALWDGWCVRRYTPDGRLDTVVELPAAQITSCAFGGSEFDDLFITSATAGLSDEQRREQPTAGAVFHVGPGVGGTPPARFAG